MLWILARYSWDFLVHPGGGPPSWCYRSPGVAPNYEPLWWPEWNERDMHPFPIGYPRRRGR